MINGRGYPDTVNPADHDNRAYGKRRQGRAQKVETPHPGTRAERSCCGSSSLTYRTSTPSAVLGIPMKVVGKDARHPPGTQRRPCKNLYYDTTRSRWAAGRPATSSWTPRAWPRRAHYFLYTTNLNHLSNDTEDFGGMMTEIGVPRDWTGSRPQELNTERTDMKQTLHEQVAGGRR